MEKKKNLRNRRRIPTDGKTPKPTQTFVTNMTIHITDKEGNTSQHGLVFDRERLTLKEMYNVGFLGDIEFTGPDGETRTEEIEAGPAGDFEGDKVGRFVFRFNNSAFCKEKGMRVTKFKFSKRNE